MTWNTWSTIFWLINWRVCQNFTWIEEAVEDSVLSLNLQGFHLGLIQLQVSKDHLSQPQLQNIVSYLFSTTQFPQQAMLINQVLNLPGIVKFSKIASVDLTDLWTKILELLDSLQISGAVCWGWYSRTGKQSSRLSTRMESWEFSR